MKPLSIRRAMFVMIALLGSAPVHAIPATVIVVPRVSDVPGFAHITDLDLINPIGIAESPMSPAWVANNGTGVATLYNVPLQKVPLVVSVPSPGNPNGGGAPTGDVFNIALVNSGFQITDGAHTASAVFMFATTGGTIVGWNPAVDPTGKFDGPNGASAFGAIAVNSGAAGAVYRGLAIASNGAATLLYAANFGQGTIDVFDQHFAPITLGPGAFTDPNLPAGFAPFNVVVLNGQLFITYAQKNGTGGGVIDEFDTAGTLLARIAANGPNGPLDAPWGLTIAPSIFDVPPGALLVGNHGDGTIDVFDPTNWMFLGQVLDPGGNPWDIPGLWALQTGNGGSGGFPSEILFTAGPNGDQDGLFGEMIAVAPGTPYQPLNFPMRSAPESGSLTLFSIAVAALVLMRGRSRRAYRCGTT